MYLAGRTAGESARNGFAQYGFRVPMAVISPWARPGHGSHRVNDRTSLCALVEATWNLPAMTYRDAHAGNPRDMVDLRFPANRRPAGRAPVPAAVTRPAVRPVRSTGGRGA